MAAGFIPLEQIPYRLMTARATSITEDEMTREQFERGITALGYIGAWDYRHKAMAYYPDPDRTIESLGQCGACILAPYYEGGKPYYVERLGSGLLGKEVPDELWYRIQAAAKA